MDLVTLFRNILKYQKTQNINNMILQKNSINILLNFWKVSMLKQIKMLKSIQ